MTDIGGKSLFVKALEQGLYENRADFAVHCVKDMPCELPQGLTMAAVLKRENPCDALVANNVSALDELPQGCVVGTASPRRVSQLLRVRPDIIIKNLRGNVITRLQKLDDGEFDAIILAMAGLERLGLQQRAAAVLDYNVFVPAIGQGALCIECLQERSDLISMLEFLQDEETAIAITAERRVNQLLGGSCQTPIGAYARIDQSDLCLQAMVGSVDGKQCLFAQGVGTTDAASALGEKIANDLIGQGAKSLLTKMD